MTTVNDDLAVNIASGYMGQRDRDLDFETRNHYPYVLNINDKYLLNFDTMALFNIHTQKEVKVLINDEPIRIKIYPSLSTIGHIIDTFTVPYYGADHNVNLVDVDCEDYDAKLTFNLDFPFISIYNAVFNHIYESTKFENRLRHHFRRL